MRKLFLTFTALATGLTSTSLFAAEDPFSDIRVSRMLVPSLPDPAWSPPRVVSRLFPPDDPRTSTKEVKKVCGTSYISARILATGELAESKVSISSGFDHLDKSALDYVTNANRYAAAHVEGKPIELWVLQPMKFSHPDYECMPKVDGSSEANRLAAEYSAPLLALVEKARAESLRKQAESQRQLDEQEQKRHAVEEPYRKRPPTGVAVERHAVYASELAKNLVHCGASRYDREEHFVIEYRGAQFTHESTDKLTEIDRANGYEWRGWVSFDCKMQRAYRLPSAGQPGWSDWEKCSTPSGSVSKRHGKWHVIAAPRPHLTCADIPPG
jgi:hypothetical protein